jgi:hypothetical protein
MDDYYKSITITNQEAIVDRYKHLISNANTLHAMKIPKEDWAWISEQLGNDITNITGKQHSIREVNVFFQVGGHRRGIHVDGWRTGVVDLKWAVNIPLVNCQDSVMTWYAGDHTLSVRLNPVGLPFLYINWATDPVEVASASIRNPIIVAVDKPHTVKNNSENPRCSISIRFTPEIFE